MAAASEAGRVPLAYPKFKRHFSEFIGVADDGHLWVDGRDCVELAETFGTPLYVLSEGQFRHNVRRFLDAFGARYPDVEVLYANKANNALAVRHIMTQEGAGGDAFGVGEMYFALLCGTPGAKLVLNGSNKSQAEIAIAVENGVCINLDSEDEVDTVAEAALERRRMAEVGIRTKLELKPLENRFGIPMHGEGSMAEQSHACKWGMTYPQTVAMVKRIQGIEALRLREISYHLSRMDNNADDFAVMAREMIEWCARLHGDTGWAPPTIDIGGDWAYGRPEKTGPFGLDDENTPSFEDFAAAVCPAIVEACEAHGLPLPGLRIEPGRAIAGTCGIALGRVGAVKTQPEYGKTWVHVDLSSNHLPRAMTTVYNHIVAANRASAPCTETVDVVGGLCIPDILGAARALPALARGDVLASLDTGAYCECVSLNFNAECRPATVMVTGRNAEVTTERERLTDVMARFRVPAHLMELSGARA